MTASLGLGTYRVRVSAVPDAVARAAADPATGWVDTAPNYLNGSAQTLLAPELDRHPVPVSTKVGFLSNSMAAAAYRDHVLRPGDTREGHSLAPRYVTWQCARNRSELGRDCLDLVFLHNPERLPASRSASLREAFMALEMQVTAGTVKAYGVATWDGFDTRAFTVADLDRLAREAAGSPEHHLRAIQLPVSLVTATALTAALDGNGPIADAAGIGWSVFASAPLFGGELPHLATRELADLIHPGLSVPQACLLATASCPGVTTALLSASSPEHWAEGAAALQQPPLTVPTLRKVLDVLATG